MRSSSSWGPSGEMAKGMAGAAQEKTRIGLITPTKMTRYHLNPQSAWAMQLCRNLAGFGLHVECCWSLGMSESVMKGLLKDWQESSIRYSVSQQHSFLCITQQQALCFNSLCSSGLTHLQSPSQPVEVREYQAFVRRHGHHGGWDPDEAADFDRILRACGGDYDMTVQICDERLVGENHEAAVAHAKCGIQFPRQNFGLSVWWLAMFFACAAAAALPMTVLRKWVRTWLQGWCAKTLHLCRAKM